MNTRPRLRTTHTFVSLEISPAAYDEIRAKLLEAGYEDTFIDERTVDMHGIGVTRGYENIPIDVEVHCQKCGAQHIDQPQPEKEWTNPPHREHECQKCGHRFKLSNHPTNGVEALPEKHRFTESTHPGTCKCGEGRIAREHY